MRTLGMHKEDIKASLRKSGKSLEQISESWGYAPTAISKALSQPWPAVQELIASRLGQLPQAIWPDRYLSDGTPKNPKQSANENNPSGSASNTELLRDVA